MKISIVGFGYVGTTLGAILAKKGQQVSAIDVNAQIVNDINRGTCFFHEPQLKKLIKEQQKEGRLKAFNDFSPIQHADVIIITVGTPLSKKGKINLKHLKNAVARVEPYLQENQLIIFKSTVPPGTTLALMKKAFEQNPKIKIAYCPERLAEGEALKDVSSIPIVVGAINKESQEAACTFWETTLGVKTIKVDNLQTAELVKLANNLWIDVNIALANELAQLCNQYNDIDALDMIKAANSLPKIGGFVNILRPSIGVGGSCLTKDPWFFHELSKSFGLHLQLAKTARKVNDEMPSFSSSLIKAALIANGKQGKSCRIAILGITFKSNTSDCRQSPVKPLLNSLIEEGYKITLYDPYASGHDARRVTDLPLCSNWKEAVRHADCVAFLAGHDALRKIEFSELAHLAAKGAIIFDGRMFYSKDQINTLKTLGLQYVGVGRTPQLATGKKESISTEKQGN